MSNDHEQSELDYLETDSDPIEPSADKSMGSEIVSPGTADSTEGFVGKKTAEKVLSVLAVLAVVTVVVGVAGSYFINNSRLSDVEYDKTADKDYQAKHPSIVAALKLIANSTDAKAYVGKNIVFEPAPFAYGEGESDEGPVVEAEYRCFDKDHPDTKFRVIIHAVKRAGKSKWEYNCLAVCSSTDDLLLQGQMPKGGGGAAIAE